MDDQITVTVGNREGDLCGNTHRILQAAVDTVASKGGGTVRILPGTFAMGNAVHLKDGVRLVGSGEDTILIKNPSRSTPLVDDMDWYEWCVRVEDPSIFEVGGGCLLRGEDPHGGGTHYTKHTVVAIEDDVLRLDSQPRKNMWITHGATVSTLFPLLTANWARQLAVRDLVLDGNRAHNAHLDGNYGGCIFLQDCQEVHIAGVVARNNEGDGISWQICHDVVVENCQSYGHRDLGLHPGSGSQRPVIRSNRVRDCRIGLFWCWGVKHGLAEGNEIRACRDYGISIGHRDTDNVMRGNRIYDSGKAGLYFRPEEPAIRGPHRNVIQDNLFEGAGTPDQPGVGIDVAGAADGVTLAGNRIVNPAGGTMSVGLRIAPQVTGLTLTGNEFVNIVASIQDLR